MNRRHRTAHPLRVLLILLGAIGFIACCATPASAAQRTLQLTERLLDSFIDSARSYRMRTNVGSTGNIAYCAQGNLSSPTLDQVLEYYGSPGIPELDYVLYHGYDGKVIKSIYGLDPKLSESATVIAVWLAVAEQRPDIFNYHDGDVIRHGNEGYMNRWESLTNTDIKTAAWNLYLDGVTYKNRGGGGVEAGCATLWLNKTLMRPDHPNTMWYQSLLTVDKKATVKFTKTSAKAELSGSNGFYSLAGARYDIHLAATGAKVATVETGADGTATLDLEPKTAYYAVETKAPLGFKLDTRQIPFKTGTGELGVDLSDEPGSVKLTIAKKDSATLGGAQRGATLAGAGFKVVSLSTPGWEREGETDEHGSLVISDIPLGRIEVIETKAPEGYRLDPEPKAYTIEAGQLTDAGTIELIPENDFREHPIAFDIELMKTLGEAGDDESGLEKPGAGIRFEIVSNTSKQVVGAIVTDEDGFASTKGLWFGDGQRAEGINGALPYDRAGYTVREDPKTTPDGFIAAGSWNISTEQMVDGATLRYAVNNAVVASRLQIVKTDARSGRVVALAGFTFQILDAGGDPVKQDSWYPNHEVKNEFTTDETGMVTLPQRLRSGTYRIKEVRAEAPYLLNGETVEFEIAASDGTIEPITVVRFSDEPVTGEATIKKTCSDDGSGLEGAEYDVVALEDVIEPDGDIAAVEDQVVAHVKTGEGGTAVAKGLSIGSGSARYAFIETAPPAGHALNDEPVEFTLTYKDQSTAVVRASVTQTDEPTTIEVDKRVTGTDAPLEGAVFHCWNAADSIELAPRTGYGAALVRLADATGDETVELERDLSLALISSELPEGFRAFVTVADTGRVEIVHEMSLEAGTYDFSLVVDGKEVDLPALKGVDIERGLSYTVRASQGLFGLGGAVERIEDDGRLTRLDWDGKRSAFGSDKVMQGSYRLLVDGEDRGALEVSQGSCTCAVIDGAGMRVVSTLLEDGREPQDLKTDDDGRLVIGHVETGTHYLVEVRAPGGYLVDPQRRTIVVGEDGRIDGSASTSLTIEDDHTKVEITKRDITTEDEIEGAALRILDADGKVVESWMSTAEPHRIDALPPGTYTLEETMTPRTHDLAKAITFTVEQTGEIQPVTLYDEPIEIEGEVDKRQEIADPIAPGTEADEGSNRAPVSASSDGSYEYSVDFRSTSTTWVDEFTVEDRIEAVEAGVAELVGIKTPQAWQDHDGKLNIWYRTDRDAPDGGEGASANATLEDGHVNPWLHHPDGVDLLGDDARMLDYTGWRLWKAGASATESVDLAVSDLGLEDGERVTAIRLEYGRVEQGFTSRSGDWNRDDLKDAHDDLASISPEHEGDAFGDGQDVRKPLVMCMKVTDAYRAGTELANDAEVHLYRNGGGEGLEDHDHDRVVQSPLEMIWPLDQTGIIPFGIAMVASGIVATGAYAVIRHPRGPVTGGRGAGRPGPGRRR